MSGYPAGGGRQDYDEGYGHPQQGQRSNDSYYQDDQYYDNGYYAQGNQSDGYYDES